MKRFLSLILCVLMVVAIVPMGLFVATAAESDEFQQLMIYENNFESSSKLVDDENTVISDATNVVWNNNGVVQLTGSSKSPYKNSTWERTFDISQTQNGKVKFEVRIIATSNKGNNAVSLNGVNIMSHSGSSAKIVIKAADGDKTIYSSSDYGQSFEHGSSDSFSYGITKGAGTQDQTRLSIFFSLQKREPLI